MILVRAQYPSFFKAFDCPHCCTPLMVVSDIKELMKEEEENGGVLRGTCPSCQDDEPIKFRAELILVQYKVVD